MSKTLFKILVSLALTGGCFLAMQTAVGQTAEPFSGVIPASGGCSCAELASLSGGNTSITAASVAKGTVISKGRRGDIAAPEDLCRVIGKINGNIHFEVWLPEKGNWNKDLLVYGNGGLAGSVNYENLATAVKSNFATASTDCGHNNSENWTMDENNKLNEERLKDWAYRSHYLTTITAKKIIAAFYGMENKYSYFKGCSGGGGHALQMAQKYPELFDGIEAGAPANFQTHMWPGELYAAMVTHSDYDGKACLPVKCESGSMQVICADDLVPQGLPCRGFIPFAKLDAIHEAVMASCDAKDGIADGLVSDPRYCDFDPYTMVCPEGTDRANCLTPAQAESVKKIYRGLQNPVTGEQVWMGYQPGSEYGWAGHVGEPFDIAAFYFRNMVFQDSTWDWHNYIGNAEYFKAIDRGHEKLAPLITATDPDLTKFKAAGGKMILWHGWDDQNIAPQNSINYYESVVKTLGGKDKTDSFVRLFMIPGMQHCNGGCGFSDFDALESLVKWVEEGIAPDYLKAYSPEKKLTRPLYPYPNVPQLKAQGLDMANPDNYSSSPITTLYSH